MKRGGRIMTQEEITIQEKIKTLTKLAKYQDETIREIVKLLTLHKKAIKEIAATLAIMSNSLKIKEGGAS